MGANTSAPSRPEPPARYLGDYGDVDDSINPIFGADGAAGADAQVKAADGEHLELGAVLDELRRKRTQANAGPKNNYAASTDSDDSELQSSSDESELRVGKLHRERAERTADAERKGLTGQIRVGEADTLMIEGSPTALSVLRLRDEVAILTGPAYSIKWYLSDDIGTLDVFQVLPIAEGITCNVPLHGLGRYIKAICTQTSTDYTRKGYQSTVGDAFNPITGERNQGSEVIRITSTVTTGPIRLPDEWFDIYAERLSDEAAEYAPLAVVLTLDGNRRQYNTQLALIPPCISLAASSADVTALAGEIQNKQFSVVDNTVTILLSDAIVRLICAGQDAPQMEICGRSEKSIKMRIHCPDNGETDISDLLFLWGLIICCQASADEHTEDDLTARFQNWLVQNRRWSPVS